MHHGVNNAHAAAVYCALTGHDRGEIGGGARLTSLLLAYALFVLAAVIASKIVEERADTGART